MPLEAVPRLEAIEALDELRRALTDDQAELEDVLNQYARARRVLARVFQEASVAQLRDAVHWLDDVKAKISRELLARFGDLLPERNLRVTGYQSPHPLLYAYLATNVGVPVPGWRLRVLTGDQVHTERRIRDFRDLGLPVTEMDEAYTLGSREPDLDDAVRRQMANKIRANSRLGTSDVMRRLGLL